MQLILMIFENSLSYQRMSESDKRSKAGAAFQANVPKSCKQPAGASKFSKSSPANWTLLPLQKERSQNIPEPTEQE